MTGLRTRPSAETFPLDDLVAFSRSGRIRIPTFQRGLRWTRRDVVHLFDSILKGFPVGSLLLWERDAPEEEVVLGAMTITAPRGPAFYVVDGQQRITALASALTEGGSSDPRFAIGYDLDADAFTPRPAHPTDAWVPAYVLYDLSALLTWFRDKPLLAERFDAAAAVSKTLRDLRLPAYVVRQDDESVLVDIFDRMNNAGKKLSRGEVFAALHRSDNANDEASLRTIAEEIQARTSFGRLDEGLVMRFILARRGFNVMREIRNEFDSSAEGRDAFAASETRDTAFRRGGEAAVLAIKFLQNTAGVPHQALLPYQYLLVALARFFAHHPQPTPRHRRLLRRFFWRAAVHGPSLVPGSTTGVSRMLNRKIIPDDEAVSIAGLMSLVNGGRVGYPPVEPFRTNTAASKVLLCAMWQHGPRSLTTGDLLLDEDLLRALADAPTATAVVAPLFETAQVEQHYLDAGNRLLLVHDEDRQLDVVEALRDSSFEVLASHLLTEQDVAIDGEAVADPVQVVGQRAGRLEELQRLFLDRMCEWEQEDSVDLGMMQQGELWANDPV